MKVVINKCYGGFGLSPIATKLYLEYNDKEFYQYKTIHIKPHKTKYVKILDISSPDKYSYSSVFTKDFGDEFIYGEEHSKQYFSPYTIERNDPILIRVVEELGSDIASSGCAELRIVEIPDDISWDIAEYDGMESIEETHRTWH